MKEFDKLLEQVGLTREDLYFEADEEPIDTETLHQGVLEIEVDCEWLYYGSAPHSDLDAVWEWLNDR